MRRMICSSSKVPTTCRIKVEKVSLVELAELVDDVPSCPHLAKSAHSFKFNFPLAHSMHSLKMTKTKTLGWLPNSAIFNVET